MSVWGKVIGGVAGFALGGPLGAILGAVAGHAVDRARAAEHDIGPMTVEARQTAFAVAMVVLSAKMAKADGRVTRDEVDAFKQIFQIPRDEIKNVAKLFDKAKRDAKGFEPYARQVGDMFAHDPAVLENLLGGLFHIAKADGALHPREVSFLRRVAFEFRFDARTFERIRASHVGDAAEETREDAYKVLGLAGSASDDEIKKTYRKLIRENHPDTLIAKGLPQEMVDIATEKMAHINAAYDIIAKERGL